VCDGDLDVVDGLASLLDKGLVRYEGTDEEPRFTMLETIREYAIEQLEARADAARARTLHAEHFLDFARTARTFARGPDALEWLDRTEVELDNVRAALAWTIDVGEGELGLSLAEALEPFWYRRFHLREGLRWLEPLLELAPNAPADVRAGALAAAGRLASELGWAERARLWYEQSLPLARVAGDHVCEAWALHGLGYVAALEGDPATARRLLEQSYELFLELGEHAPAGGRLSYLAYLARLDGDLAAAKSYAERSVEQYREAGDAAGVAGSLLELGDVALEERDWTGASHWYGEALAGSIDHRDLMYLFAGTGALAASTGRRVEAARLWGAAERIAAEDDQGLDPNYRAQYEQLLGELNTDEVAAGRASPTEDAVALAEEIVRAPIPTPAPGTNGSTR
jgi:tetratricopeptide (TPR) repeat protein